MAKKEKKDDSLRNNDDSLKELYERQKNEIIRRKLDTKEIERYSVVKVVNNGRKNNYGNLKEKENSDSVVKVKVEVKDKTCNSFKEEIDERLKLIDRIENNSLIELAKKIEILNLPTEKKEIKRDITVLNTTDLSDNEKTDRYISNTICHRCKGYAHTKKQCDRHNKIVKQISKLEFEKEITNKLMKIFNISQKEIDQVKKELKSTNPLKINKRKRKQKDIIMKLIENLPNHYKDKK